MHELLMKVTGMRLKGDFLAEVFVLWSMGNELVPSPQTLMHGKELRSRLQHIISLGLCKSLYTEKNVISSL